MDIRADLGEELAVNVGLFVALGICHAALVDLPQQHPGKALVQFAESLIQAEGNCCGRSPFFFLHGHGGQSHPAALGLPAVAMGIYIAVIDVGGNVRKELPADGIGGPVKA